MQDVITMMANLRRPRMLSRAAQLGAQSYDRDRALPRLLGPRALPRPAAALMSLMEIEADLNARRLSRDAVYSLQHHVDVLIAMTGEFTLLRNQAAPTAV